MTFKETLLATIEDNRLEMLMPSREYTEEELQLIQDDREALMNESFAKQKRAHKLVWKYIEHNIQRWWD